MNLDRRHFLALSLAAVAAAGVGCTSAASRTQQPEGLDLALAKLDGLVEDLMRSTGVPGVAVAVVNGDETVFSKGFGVRDLRHSGPVDADTVFQLASVSKSVGATVVAQELSRQGRTWDDPIRPMLPWFELSDPAVNDVLTLGDLYSHRTGLPDHAGDILEELGYSQRTVLERLRHYPLDTFRTSYHYTNFGLTAAAMAVAEAAGTDWASLSERTLYAPLGMSHTSSRVADFLRQENRTIGHQKVDGAWKANAVRHPEAQAPAASVSSSVNDMAKWMSMVLGNGTFAGTRIVDAERLEAALSPQVARSATGDHYGFGFNVSTNGHKQLSHSGAFTTGVATSFRMVPATGLGIVALTNGFPVGLPEALCAQFFDLVDHGEITRDYLALMTEVFAELAKPTGELVGVPRPALPAPPQPLNVYAGAYRNDLYGVLHITEAQGSLRLALADSAWHTDLTHWEGDIFTIALNAEDAVPGSISKVTFAGDRVTLEYFDDTGLGTFIR